MNPAKVDRTTLKRLTDLPNIGKATAADLGLIGVATVAQLKGEDPFDMYDRLCRKTGRRHDPCVIDVFMSIVEFMCGGDPLPWWAFSDTRRKILAGASGTHGPGGLDDSGLRVHPDGLAKSGHRE